MSVGERVDALDCIYFVSFRDGVQADARDERRDEAKWCGGKTRLFDRVQSSANGHDDKNEGWDENMRRLRMMMPNDVSIRLQIDDDRIIDISWHETRTEHLIRDE